MNICLVGDLDPHPEQNLGGPQFVTYNLANALSQSHDVTVVVESAGESFHYDHINVVSINTKSDLLDGCFGERFYRTARFSRGLSRLLERGDWDIVNAHSLLFLDLVDSPIPVIATFHGAETKKELSQYDNRKERFTNEIWSLMKKRFVQCASGTTAVSEKLASEMERHYGERPHVIYNGVSGSMIQPSVPVESKKNICCVGYIERRKNQEFLLKHTPHKYAEDLRLIGAAKERDYYEMLRAKYNGIADTALLGRVSENQLEEEYEAARICVIPSTHENFPLVGLEAMAKATPLLAKRGTTGITEIITDGKNGLIFEDEREYKSKLKRIMEDDEYWREMSQAALHTVSEIRWADITDDYVSIYKEYIRDE